MTNMHPIIQAEVDEFRKEFGHRKTFLSENKYYYNNEFEKEIQSFLSAALHRAVERAGKEMVGEIKKEIVFIEEGIQACKDDSALEDCKGDELQYIFGKSQALKIVQNRLFIVLSKLDTIINFKENEK